MLLFDFLPIDQVADGIRRVQDQLGRLVGADGSGGFAVVVHRFRVRGAACRDREREVVHVVYMLLAGVVRDLVVVVVVQTQLTLWLLQDTPTFSMVLG